MSLTSLPGLRSVLKSAKDLSNDRLPRGPDIEMILDLMCTET